MAAKYQNTLTTQFGLPLSGATVTVRVANATPGSGTLATIFSDDGTTVISGSAVTTDSKGRFEFYAADGKYDLTVTGSGVTTQVFSDIEIADITEKLSTDTPIVANAKNLNAIRFADQFTGASTGDKVEAAAADFAAAKGLVIIPSTMATGGETTVTSAGPSILDLRQSAQAQNAARATYYTRHYPTTTPTVEKDYIWLNELHVMGGGINQTGGPKSTHGVASNFSWAHTPGQHIGEEFRAYHMSGGDAIGISSIVDAGRLTAGGDEGGVAYRGEVQFPPYYNTPFTGTISAINGSVLSYTSGTNRESRGEGRPLIITTGARVNAVTVVSVSGTPPTVVLSGDQTAMLGGVGASKTNIFFEFDDVATNGSLSTPYKWVVPIKEVQALSAGNTPIVLDFTAQGGNQAWPSALATSGTGKIYRGGTVTAIGRAMTASGTVTVNNVSDFLVGDTVEEAHDYLGALSGFKLNMAGNFPLHSSTAISIYSGGKYNVSRGLLMQGGMDRAIEIATAPKASSGQPGLNYGLMFNNTVWGNGATPIWIGGQANSQTLNWLSGQMQAGTLSLQVTKSVNPNIKIISTEANAFTFDVEWNNVAANAGAQLFRVTKQGVPFFYVMAGNGVIVNNGNSLKVLSGNQSGETGSFDGSNGRLTAAQIVVGGGTTLTKVAVYTPSLTPASVAADTVATQTFAVNGLTTTDTIIAFNHPSITAGVAAVSMRVSAADTLEVAFANTTSGALTPAAGTYRVVAVRS